MRAFGRAFEKLAEPPTDDQAKFLERAVAELSHEGRIVCVRLAVFAEMMKGRPWTITSLREVGGAEGIGETFLEETFSARTAPPAHRVHEKAIRAVLMALLPEHGTDIKGRMQSFSRLLDVSGYGVRRSHFDALIRILDAELRLITPTEPDGESDVLMNAVQGDQYYQLTHDYLVPALREWLTRRQKETVRGRAELRLAERAALWNAKRENRRLPSCIEYLSFLIWTKKRKRTRARQSHASRCHSILFWSGTVVLSICDDCGNRCPIQSPATCRSTSFVDPHDCFWSQ